MEARVDESGGFRLGHPGHYYWSEKADAGDACEQVTVSLNKADVEKGVERSQDARAKTSSGRAYG